jgi:hypothetical protein
VGGAAAALAAEPARPRHRDDGLIDLAASGAARRLLELDLEQDCWNARKRGYGVPLPDEVIDPASFPSLDAMFLGIVDEYHGARYSCGFPEGIWRDLASASTTRPELAAFLTHLDVEQLDDTDDPDQSVVSTDYDFRTERTAHHGEYLDQAKEFAQRMIEGDIGWPPPAP